MRMIAKKIAIRTLCLMIALALPGAITASAQADNSMEMMALRKALEQSLRENIALRSDLEAAKSELDRLRGGAERPLALMTPPAEPAVVAAAAPLVEAPIIVTYIVKVGDTLGSIAAKHYGTPAAYRKIFQANRAKLSNPNRIAPGQVLILP